MKFLSTPVKVTDTGMGVRTLCLITAISLQNFTLVHLQGEDAGFQAREINHADPQALAQSVECFLALGAVL